MKLSPLVLVSLLAFSADSAAGWSEEALLEASPILARVVVVGASASAGFLLEADVGARTTLSDVLGEALLDPQAHVVGESSAGFFMDPLEQGTLLAERARKHDPSLVVALDFPFWFGYGNVLPEEGRLALLEHGLELLASFDCPLVVGDFPDMTPALQGTGPFGAPMIFASQIPKSETLARLNERLYEWAENRGDVHVVPMSTFVARLTRGGTLELRGNRWSDEALKGFLQDDLLHPTLVGSAALVVLALDVLANEREDVRPESIRWDAEDIARRVYDSKAEARREVEARKRSREERRRKREQRARAREGG